MIRTSEPSSLEELSQRLGLNETPVAHMLAEKCSRGTLAKREDRTYGLHSQAQLGELIQTVAYCERMWRLQDRLDAAGAAPAWGGAPAR